MNAIKNVNAIEILDSRGNPTVEAEIVLDSGHSARGAVPSGASTGIREAVELRDCDKSRYFGKGVQLAVANVNKKIAPVITGMNAYDQSEIDHVLIELDGTKNKENLGANATLAVSMAVARAAANASNLPVYDYLATSDKRVLPIPLFNILNGGAHANNNIDIQEFMVVPLGMANFSEALRCAVEVYHALKSILDMSGFSTAVGDEGGFAPNLDSNAQTLELVCEAVEKAGYEPGTQVGIALDVASSELFRDDAYHLPSENLILSFDEMIDYLEQLCQQFPIISIEDGMSETDWEGWKSLTKRLGNKVQLVGDDVFVTNPDILKSGIASMVGNAVLVKLNQIGSVTETLDAVRIAQDANYGVVISHRSGETEDTFIADFAVATGAGQLKAGAPCRSDRTSKFNQLLRIQAKLNDQAHFSQSLS